MGRERDYVSLPILINSVVYRQYYRVYDELLEYH